jgi:hypothetical protein
MNERTFISKIHAFVLARWRDAVQEGEDRYSRYSSGDVGSLSHVAKIRDFAQLRIVSNLVTLKGEWLSPVELRYTLDLFNRLIESFEYFGILQFEDSKACPMGPFHEFLVDGGRSGHPLEKAQA